MKYYVYFRKEKRIKSITKYKVLLLVINANYR